MEYTAHRREETTRHSPHIVFFRVLNNILDVLRVVPTNEIDTNGLQSQISNTPPV